MKKRNVFVFIITTLLASLFLYITNAKVNATVTDNQKVTQGIPSRFKGIWVSDLTKETLAKNMPYSKIVYFTDAKPYGVQSFAFNKNKKPESHSDLTKMYNPSYQPINKNSFYFMFGYSKKFTTSEMYKIQFIGKNKIVMQAIDPQTGKNMFKPLYEQKYSSYKKAIKAVVSNN